MKRRRRNKRKQLQNSRLGMESLENRQLLTAISLTDVTVSEDVGTFDVTVRLSESHASPVQVTLGTASGSATGGEDYVIGTSDVTIAAGQLSAKASFEIVNDDVVEPTQAFSINVLGDPVGVTVDDDEATITILDDDTPTLSVADATGDESSGQIVFTATLSDPANTPVTLITTVSSGTATVGSSQTDDLAGFPNFTLNVEIPAGQTSATIVVPITNDSIQENPETFLLNVLDAIGADIGARTATGTIVDDDAEFRTIDGTNNHVNDPTKGAANTKVIRRSYNPGYPEANGARDLLGNRDALHAGDRIDVINAPNPRDVSNQLMAQSESVPSARNLSDWVVQWGQFLTHDMALVHNGSDNNVLSNGSTGNFGIPVTDPNDPLGPGPIPFNRSDFDPATGTTSPRDQINSVTSYIDASVVYGSDQDRANALRTFSGGRLKTSAGNLPPLNTAGFPVDNPSPLPDEQMFLVGDERGSEATGLIANQTIFLREHNRIAGIIDAQNPSLSDEEIYQWSRRIVGAEIQKITYEEYLPAVMGEDAAPDPTPKEGPFDDDGFEFDPASEDPSITNSFTTAFFRFGHSMQSSELLLVDNNGSTVDSLPLSGIFNRPDIVINNPGVIDQTLKGLASQVAQENDVLLVDGVRNFLFGRPGAGGLDLGALDIQRGRDHGLLSMNGLRPAYNLSNLSSPTDPNEHPFSVITSDPEIQEALASLYDTIDEVDAFVGAIAEDHLPGSSVGETLNASMFNQFQRLRDGDRFFYTGDTQLQNPIVTRAVDLETRTLANIIRDNSSITNIQPNVFFTDLPELDFDDAPGAYPTTLAEDGARHLATGPRLGATRTVESDANNNDAGDDGVTFGALEVGQTGRVAIDVDGAAFGRIDAWIDFNQDGDWSDIGEQIIDSQIANRIPGSEAFGFEVPSNARPGSTAARVRVSTEGNLSPTGFAGDGEVEGYTVNIASTTGQTRPTAQDDVAVASNSGLTPIPASLLLANDFDADGSSFSISDIDSLTAQGARISSDGQGGFIYDPSNSEALQSLPQGSQVTDSFDYTIRDTGGLADSATVTITVSGSVAPPPFPDFNVGSDLGDAVYHDIDLADLDGDGDLDAYLTSQTDSDKIWINIGGGYTESLGQEVNQANSIYASLGDVDLDGDIDVVIAASTEVAVWKNDGNAKFTKHAAYEISSAVDVALGDLNGDGYLDFFVARSAGQDQVWLNNGRGSYSDSALRLYSGSSKSVELGDIDGDGDLDAIIGSLEANTVWKNSGFGFFFDTNQRLGNEFTEHVALGDLDSDGDLDAYVANSKGTSNFVYFNDGSGIYADSGQRLGNSTTSHVTLADLDSDGDLDAVTANWFFEEDKIWANLGNGYYADSGVSLPGTRSSHVAAGDIDRDGDLDVLYASFASESNRVWYNSPASPVPVSNTYSITEGQALVLDASASTDPLGRLLVFSWDLDNDGEFDKLVGPIESVSSSELETFGLGVGEHTLTLRAAALGTTDFADTTVTLSILAKAKATATGPTITASSVSSQTITVTYMHDEGIDASDIGANDISVMLPNGSTRIPTFVSKSTNSDSKTVTATYRLSSLGSFYRAPDSGTYMIQMRANQVSDVYGAFIPAGKIGSFEVNIDGVAPTASVNPYSANSWNVNHTFEVTYRDNVQVDASTIGADDIEVRTPSGFAFRPTYVTHSPDSDSNSITVTYQFSNVNGFSPGSYEVRMRSRQVSDTSGNWVSSRSLGNLWLEPTTTELLGAWPKGGGKISVYAPSPIQAGGIELVAELGILTQGASAAPFAFYIPNGSAPGNVTFGSIGTPLTIDGLLTLEVTVAPNAVTGDIKATWGDGVVPTPFPVVSVDSPTAMAMAPDVVGTATSFQTITVTYKGIRIDAPDIGTNDIEVVFPNGSIRRPSFVSKSTTSDVSEITATYRLAAPGGFYSRLDNGTYTIRMRPNEVMDIYGPIKPGDIGSFIIDVDDVAPQAVASAPDISRGRVSTQTISVTYSDNVAVNEAGIGARDIQVVTPNGSIVQPRYLSHVKNSDGTFTAQYQLSAPGGFYDSLENGTYSIQMRSNQVADLSGNQVRFGQIGSFRINIDDVAPTATAIAANITTQLEFQAITVTYTDNVAINTSDIGQGDIEVMLPNGSVVRPEFLLRSANSNTNVVTATYRLNAPGGFYDTLDNGTYKIRMRSHQVSDPSGQFVPATQIGTFTVSVDSERPTAIATAPDINGTSVRNQTITVVYSDNVNVNVSSVGVNDIEVVLPNGTIRRPVFLSSNRNTATGDVTTTYRLDAPGGFYRTLDNGSYRINMRANQVTDTSGNYVAAAEIGSFGINIPVPVDATNDTLTVYAMKSGANSNQASANLIANDISSTTMSIASVNGRTERTVHGDYGRLTWQENGTVTYETDSANSDVQNLPVGQTLSERFRYTVTNGTTFDSANLQVTIKGVWQPVPIYEVSELQYGGEDLSTEALMGDFDGDGDLDVFVGSQGGPDTIWLNNGRGQFTDSGQRLGNGRTIYGEVGDIDRDGDLDIVVASFDENLVWVNDGNGNFNDSGQVLGDPTVSSYDVALGDLNGDGYLDAVIVNQNDNFESDWIFYNDGTGKFNQVPASFGWYNSTSVSLADLDSDNDLDIVVTSFGTGATQFLLNDGRGNFTDSLNQVIADTQWSDVPYRKIRNNISGTVNTNEDLSAQFKVHWDSSNLYVLVDVEDDVLVNDGGVHIFNDGVSVYIDGGNEKRTSYDANDHNFTFAWNQSSIRHGNGFDTAGVLKAERRTDSGYIMEMSIPWDVIGVTPSEGNTIGLDVHVNDDDDGGDRDKKITWHGLTDFSYSNPSLHNAYALPAPCSVTCDFGLLLEGPYAARGQHVELGDIDGDGDIDAIDATNGPNRVWLNNGDGRFVDSGQQIGDELTSQVLLQDLNNDGHLDLLVANWTGDANEIWLNNGEGIFIDSGARLDGTIATEHVAMGDIDGDGDMDAFVSAWGWSNRVYVNTVNTPEFPVEPPTITLGSIADVVGENQSLDVSFDQDVSRDLHQKLKLTNQSTGQSVTVSSSDVVWDAVNNRASFSLDGIPPGQYLLVLGNLANQDGVLLDGDSDGVAGGSYSQSLIITWQGDTDLDSDVDFADFLTLATNFGNSTASWSNGDFNGDGFVSFYDFLQLSSSFGQSFDTGVVPSDLSGPQVLFYLDFNSSIADGSGQKLPVAVGSSVTPGAEGPVLQNGRQLTAGEWAGTNDEANQILIFDNPVLDEVLRSAGSIVTWVYVENDSHWNNIAKTICPGHVEPCGDTFGPDSGLELQANDQNGVFSAVQGWRNPGYGPTHTTNDGPGGTETPSNQWVHVAFSWNDQGQQTIYINGVAGMESEARPSYGLNKPRDWSIGGDALIQPNDPNNRRLEGKLADFAILGDELNEIVLEQIINGGVAEAELRWS